MKNIAITGKAGAGKDTLAQALGVSHGHLPRALAAPIKDFVRRVFDIPHDVLYGPSELRNLPRPELGGAAPRVALQKLGTEWARSFDPDVWVKLLLREAACINEGELPICVTDVRFENEARLLHKAGFLLIEVRRQGPSEEEWRDHASEAGIGSASCLLSHVFLNYGTLEEFHQNIDAWAKGALG